MTFLTNFAAVLIGVAALGTMRSTVPDYNSSFQPFAVYADKQGIGQGRLFSAKLVGLKTAGAISFSRFGEDVWRDTSATFLIAQLSITGRSESRQLEAIWVGATGRQYTPSDRLYDVPRNLSSARFEPGLTDRTVVVFELPEDEIVGGQLGLVTRSQMVMDRAVHFAGPAIVPEKQTNLRLEP
ncbi:hypothetical protein H7Q97_17350 [Ochrobactrum sp. CM-21-5]|nr:hypothetical protein [Ochrobactrum sp. CM-21-5]MBC2887151.1 hypothetical protein [Ochrobactrum sp. CM-21-5]